MARKQTDTHFLGAHMPVAGGLHKAFERIASVGGTAMQIFTRNQRQWKTPDLDPETIAAFSRAWEEWGPYPVAAHDSYLVNLASPEEELAERSVAAVANELTRLDALRIPWLVTHPGAHKGRSREQGLTAYAANLDRALEASRSERAMVLLETTAGAGTVLGGSFGELGAIIGLSRHPERLGVCLDTCHAFTAGYDLRTPEAYEQTMAELDREVGLSRVRLLHLNDSKHPLGSHKDRHEHIGRGELGDGAFRRLLQDPRWSATPMVLETPKEKDLKADKRNLARLRRLARIAG